ncbi:hypothetical protein L917_01383 [Phytophthora nicotianae]|uniref:Uncharacterized protein n=1 Tax=Phytophthora nicotianae TaxID=4792 RepID=W2LZU0_PHYNI|nr:hypothetical protein L915_01904 [Phytophthora nicotianae]ETM02096.1 hypothetical protein L917_01383 [Phytophthora nicotianae]
MEFDKPATSADSLKLKRRQGACEVEYIDTAHQKFYKYLVLYWTKYKTDQEAFVSRYLALVQSSGFGKSRLLREVSNMAKTNGGDSGISR